MFLRDGSRLSRLRVRHFTLFGCPVAWLAFGFLSTLPAAAYNGNQYNFGDIYVDHTINQSLARKSLGPGVSQIDAFFGDFRESRFSKCFLSDAAVMRPRNPAQVGSDAIAKIRVGHMGLKRYAVVCSGGTRPCEGLRFLLSGVGKTYVSADRSKPYPVLEVNLGVNRTTLIFEFSGPETLVGRKISIYQWGPGEFGEYGPGCKID